MLVALLALVVGAGGGFLAAGLRPGARPFQPGGPASPAPDLGLPARPPASPGTEPPQGGGWPTQWPKFAPADRTRRVENLPGLGFSFQVPQEWDCKQQAQGTGFVRYNCGMSSRSGLKIGGDVIVRQCLRPCSEERRTELRRAEEAFGQQWIRSGPFATWAETRQVGGEARYGLVYVAYWRSVPEEAIDRQLVLRMTGPLLLTNDIRKVANSIRDVTFTL